MICDLELPRNESSAYSDPRLLPDVLFALNRERLITRLKRPPAPLFFASEQVSLTNSPSSAITQDSRSNLMLAIYPKSAHVDRSPDGNAGPASGRLRYLPIAGYPKKAGRSG